MEVQWYDRGDDFGDVSVHSNTGIEDAIDQVDHSVSGFLILAGDHQAVDGRHLLEFWVYKQIYGNIEHQYTRFQPHKFASDDRQLKVTSQSF